ncbi:MAG: class II aldolase/adducin family protein [Burkholderiaceae bacterium]|nr:class II aldolase/adducin family protein [Burkholderiaceae bacterium]
MPLTALRELLVREARRLEPLGLTTGTSGNLSVRVDLGGDGGMLITPSGIAYDQLQPEDIVPVVFTGAGTATWEHALEPSSEWLMHQAVYQARPEAGAVVHGHPTYATVLAIQGREIPALHYMIAAAGGPTIRCAPYFTYGTPELSIAAVEALDGRKACLLGHHGLLAFERDLPRAMWLAREVETLAQQTLMCLQLGGPKLLPPSEIDVVVEKFSRYGLKQR